jgi:hypothetical protein
MDFKTLHEMIPRATGDKLHVMEMKPYPNITLAMPGRHQDDTDPQGGDFVVMVDDVNKGWVKHQFTHGDLWHDLEKKKDADKDNAVLLMKDYASVVRGADPESTSWDFENGLVSEDLEDVWEHTLLPQTFLYAVQCLAVAEHRRYWQHESRAGGKWLPLRFSFGIVMGAWTAKDCERVQRRGRIGIETLEKETGFKSGKTILRQFAEQN